MLEFLNVATYPTGANTTSRTELRGGYRTPTSTIMYRGCRSRRAPGEDAEHEVEHEERADDDERHEVHPVEERAMHVVRVVEHLDAHEYKRVAPFSEMSQGIDNVRARSRKCPRASLKLIGLLIEFFNPK